MKKKDEAVLSDDGTKWIDVSLVKTRKNVVVMNGFGEVKTNIKTVGDIEATTKKQERLGDAKSRKLASPSALEMRFMMVCRLPRSRRPHDQQ